jgi:hypothetical protein
VSSWSRLATRQDLNSNSMLKKQEESTKVSAYYNLLTTDIYSTVFTIFMRVTTNTNKYKSVSYYIY